MGLNGDRLNGTSASGMPSLALDLGRSRLTRPLDTAPVVLPASEARRRGGGAASSVSEQLREARLDYDAALPSRFKRRRTRLYGSGSAHLTAYHADQIREYARDMVRNDAIVGAIAWRAVDNVVRTGLSLVPQTGDPGLNVEMKARWDEWAADPRLCDVRETHTFSQLERLAAFTEIVDGDVFALFDPEGRVQLVEGEWCASPRTVGGTIYNGVELNEAGAPVAYHFVEELQATRFSHSVPRVRGDARRIARFDRNGFANVAHIYSPDRVTQYRGVTAFHAVFDRLGMLEDIEFARLVQQQLVSCLAVFLSTDAMPPLGTRTEQTSAAGGTEVVEAIEAGTIMRLREGEKPHTFSPNVPNPEFFDHVRHMLRTVAAALGLPLEVVLFDTTDTNFHGYRGAMQQARIGFECKQKALPARFHRLAYARNVARWLPQLGRAGATAWRRGRLTRHDWHGAGFPYVDPKKDAEADDLRRRTLQASPRRIAQERGYRYEDIVAESVDDAADAIQAAHQRARELSGAIGEEVPWSALLGETFGDLATQPPAADDPDEPEDEGPATPTPEEEAALAVTGLESIPRRGRRTV